MRKFPWRGLLCVLLLPWHTLLASVAAMACGLLQPRGQAAMVPVGLWFRVVLATAGVRVRVRGPEQALPGPYVIVANHQSLFDIPALATVWKGPFCMVAKRSLFRIPLFGWGMRLSGFVPVDRGHTQSAVASLSRALEELRRGISVVLFAEGTRSPDGKLQKLKKGPFRLAQQAGVPVLPVTISGSRAVLPRQGWLPRPGAIEVVLGTPLPPPRPGDRMEDSMRETAAALRTGYTARHRDDLKATTKA